MAYRVKINNVANHPTGSMIFFDKKESIKMVITGDWKTIAKKTEKLKKWEAGKLVQVETLKAAKADIEKEIEKADPVIKPVIEEEKAIEVEKVEPIVEKVIEPVKAKKRKSKKKSK